MSSMTTAEQRRLSGLRDAIQFGGTAEMGFTDSGLWKYLAYVNTKDSQERGANIVKRLPVAQKDFLKILFLFMLCFDRLLIPKSRQMMVSWAMSAYGVWTAMSSPYRHVLYQTKKDKDGHKMVTEGSKNPAGGRMDFIMQHHPEWLEDKHVTSGAGNLVGNLIFTPEPIDDSGNSIPWHGSRIESVPGGPDQVRGTTATLVQLDEAAFHDMLNKVITAVNQAVKNGQLHIASSVNAGSDFNAVCLNTLDGGPPVHEIPEIIQTAMDIMGIRWPRGMKTWTTLDGFQALELHYTSDPAKDPDRNGAAWVAEAVKGYPGGFEGQGWKTEMEVNYEAGGGEKVFPFLSQSLCPVFIPSIDPADAIARMNVFAGYDYGTNSPSAFEVWGIDDKGDLYALWELYEPMLDYAQHFNRIKRCPYFEHLDYIAADNKIFSKTQQTANGVQAVSALFHKHGIPISRARQGMDYPIAMRFLSEYWPGGKTGWDKIPPRAFITDDCPNLKMEVRGLKFQEHVSSIVASRKNNVEKLVDKNNHGWDASSYAIDRCPSMWVPSAANQSRDSISAFLTRSEQNNKPARSRRGGIVVSY